jgi:acetate kinase
LFSPKSRAGRPFSLRTERRNNAIDTSIGENAWRIWERVCQGFEWFGLELDKTRNQEGEMIVSSDRSRVRVLVIPTNEEMMIARP